MQTTETLCCVHYLHQNTLHHFILLGKETAIKLASLGADIIILCRNPEKAEEAVADIKRESGFTSVRYGIPADRYSYI